jgi:transcriptional regulator with XRE-family HTH domain
MVIKTHFRDARKARGLTLRAAAAATGVTTNTLIRLERDNAVGVQFGTLRLIAAAYGIRDIRELLSIEEEA